MCVACYIFHLLSILFAGMTNRRDLIDEALLRPGRLEVQMEIGIRITYLNPFLGR